MLSVCGRNLSVWAVFVLYCLGLRPEQAVHKNVSEGRVWRAGAQSRRGRAALGRESRARPAGCQIRTRACRSWGSRPLAGTELPSPSRERGGRPEEPGAGAGGGRKERRLRPSLRPPVGKLRGPGTGSGSYGGSIPAESRAQAAAQQGPGESCGDRGPQALGRRAGIPRDTGTGDPPPPAAGPALWKEPTAR